MINFKCLFAGVICSVTTLSARAANLSDWPEYLFNVQHSSVTISDTITPDNVVNLHKVWRFKPPVSAGSRPPPQIFASPTVVGGKVFVGFNNGIFYALNLASGRPIWQRDLGYVPQITCAARGFTSTATVRLDPTSGELTVYVNAGDGYLYALNAANGATKWRALVAQNSTTVNGYYNWTSPAVANGKIYVGLSSECDKPFVRGAVKAFDQATGDPIATHWTMADGKIGGGVWSSIGVSLNGEVYATTGSTKVAPYPQGESYSILQLNGNNLEEDGIWTVPPGDLGSDSDFGASPTLFPATVRGEQKVLVAACNKNGQLYAWDAANVSIGPVWVTKLNSKKVSPCFGATIYDGAWLFQVGNPTVINGVAYRGSINKIDPSTGYFIWRKGIPGSVFGSASLNGAGIIAIPTFDSMSTENGTYFVDATSGEILHFIGENNAKEFAQPIFADKYVLLSPVSQGISAYTP